MTRMWLRNLALLGCCGALFACGSSPPTRFYILNEIAPASPVHAAPAPAAAAAAATAKQVPMRVEPVAITPELDRPELVSRTGPNRVHVAGSERWAAPLADQIRRVLSDDLSARLPPGLVADPNETATTDPRRLLTIAIAEFYGDDSCAVDLRASWSMTNPHAASQRGSEQVQLPASSPCPGDLPAAMSRALALLSDRLAAVIAAN
ncbi:MAG: membrane integrity-associated transporter subunit PqiC [Steroidobacterales bacterium]